MVAMPRFGRLRLPRITPNWRARLRAQRAWWRRRLRALAGDHEVLVPAAGGGVVAVETLSQGAGPRIAILHATAGSGHKSAAVAISRALHALAPDAQVSDVDALVFASRFYRTSYSQGYSAMAQRAPRLWGALYALWAQDRFNKRARPAREALDRLALRGLVRVVERERPDAIVCTHFLPVEALYPIRGKGKLTVPLHVVITDFAAHPAWAYPYVDRYFVANDMVAEGLVGFGVPCERIEVTGIPVDPRFALTTGREAVRARFGFALDRPLVLIMGGGGGVGPMAELAERLAGLTSQPTVVVLCGSNETLKAKVDALSAAAGGRIHAMGFTTQVDLLLEAADLVVSKAGGLTCSEALIKHTPLVVFKPTPGQEVENARYLEAGGAAVHADSLETVAATVARWLDDPEALQRARENCARLARPQAARDIATRVLESIGRGARSVVSS